jgi:hypothetical protein
MNRYWLFLLALAGVAAGVSSAAPVASAATTYYASPAGSGSTCSQAAPCSIEEAAEKPEDGDAVVLAPGHYALGSAIGLYKNIQFGSSAGVAATVIETTSAHNIYTFGEAHPTIHDLTIEGQGGLVINEGRGERIYVNYTGGSSSACSLGIGGALVDSVCWNHGTGSYGIEAEASGGEEGTVVLRNDTVVSSQDDAIYMRAETSGALRVEGVNVIARGTQEADLYADFSGFSTVEANFSHSDYGTIEQFPPFTEVTAPGTDGNITAAPAFVDAAGGNFAEPAGAPTVEAGLNEPANGVKDILGNERVLPTCIGGSAVTDIGAYELVPTTACASSATAPPAPVTPPSNRFTIGKLVRNTKKGTAKLSISVPDAGALTLSGKGVKKVSRSAKGAATLSLPIVATGKAKAQLAAKGKAKLKLTLRFSPSGGSAATQVKKVTLIKKHG